MTSRDVRSPWGPGPFAPSGRQVRITRGDQEAVVTGVGATLRAYTVAGEPVIDGFGPGEACEGGRGQPLIPWPNRLEDGQYDFDGSTYQVDLSEPENHNAIHGLLRWATWDVAELHTDRAVMSHVLFPTPGYPFVLGVALSFTLTDEGLVVEVKAGNLCRRRLPLGIGFHPYLTLGTPVVDPVVLSVPASTMLRSDDRGIPIGSSPVEGTPFDFRAGKPVGDMRLDTCFTGLERDGDGMATARLRDPGSGRALTLWADTSFSHLMCFTGDTLDPRARRRGLAVEPMTCPPNALRSGDGSKVLEPGEEMTARWGLTPHG
ncbi:MAG: aldose 1-epimerase family protein [Acidimicrobiales bacterium]